jgi:hypothetical protein
MDDFLGLLRLISRSNEQAGFKGVLKQTEVHKSSQKSAKIRKNARFR